MYQVALASAAQAAFENAEASLQRKLDRCFQQLASDPRKHNNIKPLTGRFAGYLRYRVGDYRVVYRIDNKNDTVIVADIAHRKDVYE